jgi:protocatechuate 3,4-dioxygenase beta subunit
MILILTLNQKGTAMSTTDFRRLSRRDFLLQSSLLAAGGLLLPRFATAQCEATTPDILGPFHVDGAPFRTVLASADEPGTRLFIQGHVHGGDCVGPVAGTIVDVWHARDDGCYSILENCPDEDPFNCRGQMVVGADGFYAFESVLPGRYLNGPTYRPRHLHFIVAPPGHPTLVTQLYFAGDPYIAGDRWASDPAAAARIIPLTEDAAGWHGVFDIDLDVAVPTDTDDDHRLPTAAALHQNFPNPFNPRTTIRYQLRVGARVRLEVLSSRGELVRRLVQVDQPPGYYTLEWDGRDGAGRAVPSGVYLAVLRAGRFQDAVKMHLIR